MSKKEEKWPGVVVEPQEATFVPAPCNDALLAAAWQATHQCCSGVEDDSYSKVATDLLGAASSYLRWGAGGGEAKDNVREHVTWCTFDYCEYENDRRLCLIIAYRSSFSKGFQVWDLSQASARELVSNRDEVVKSAKFLPNPLKERKQDVKDLRPLLAVLSADHDRRDRQGAPLKNSVRLYSLKAHRMVSAPTLKFESEVLRVECNRRVICVALRKSIHVLSATDLSRIRMVDCFPSMSPVGVMSLGSRWLAYAANKELSIHDTNLFEEEQARNPSGLDMVDVGAKVGTTVASGLMYLGEMTSKAVSTYYYGDAHGPTSREALLAKQKADGMVVEAAGTVSIHDLEADEELIQVRIDYQPLGAVGLDPSGTLLAASTVDGRHVNVVKLSVNKGAASYAHLYKLRRGITNATIQNLQFSFDSQWLAIGSSHGTWHFYATNMEGGPVDVETHPPLDKKIPLPHASVSYGQPALLPEKKSKPLVTWLTASTKIKLSNVDAAADQATFVPLACAFVPTVENGVLLVNDAGILTHFQLAPEPTKLPNGAYGKELVIHSKRCLEWDICRKKTWPTTTVSMDVAFRRDLARSNDSVLGQAPAEETAEFLPSLHETRWLTQLEMATFGDDFKPLYSIPKFHFKKFQPDADPAADAPDLLAAKVEPTASIFEPIQAAESIIIKRKEPLPFKTSPQHRPLEIAVPDDGPEDIYGDVGVEAHIRAALETPLASAKPMAPETKAETPELFDIGTEDDEMEHLKMALEDSFQKSQGRSQVQDWDAEHGPINDMPIPEEPPLSGSLVNSLDFEDE